MKKHKLRSQQWFGDLDKNGFMYRLWMKNQGIPNYEFEGKPIIGICNTWSELTPCNAHLRRIAEKVKHGVLEAGGYPLEFPVFSNGESNLRPTAMFTRNLASMDVEEAIRGNPIDGPMLSGRHKGKLIGSGTAVWQLSESFNKGEIDINEFLSAESCMSRSAGSCNTMGTASTMASLVEGMGIALPQNAAIPAVDSRRYELAQISGTRIVEMVQQNLSISKIITRDSLLNAIVVNAAIGGSTNAVIHLKAIAGRLDIDLQMEDWATYGNNIPTLLNLMPSGKYLMEDFYYAGGLPVIIKELIENQLLPNPESLTVTGKSIKDNNLSAINYNDEMIKSVKKPLLKNGGIRILRGNLAPNGAVIKPSAASKHLLKHSDKAVVFENLEDYKLKIKDPNLDIDENSIMVLKNCGPKGYPGMAEVGNMELPAKLLKKGIKDLIRISDARMSGTAYGTVILHVSPEAAVRGVLAIVENGDIVNVDCNKGILHLNISDDEIIARLEIYRNSAKKNNISGYEYLFVNHVLQADEGCDFDFLKGQRGAAVPKHSH